jgi:serine/threonine protein kinase
MSLSAGALIGPYDIQELIGAGGMGEVYRATDRRLGSTVAIKTIPAPFASRRDHRRRFEIEARAIASLNHPHICALYDIGEQADLAYMVMEFVEGESFASRLNREKLPLGEALTYGAQIAEALDQAHRRGIVHRDLKPGNVMLTRTGIKPSRFWSSAADRT